jgi:hypothetical protein
MRQGYFATEIRLHSLLLQWSIALSLMLLGDIWRESKEMVTKINSITLSFPKCEQAAT